ncbi:MAG: DUF4240 domain-containing protein [Bacteroidota bacterium]
MSVLEIKSKIGIDELLGELRQLDATTLDYLVTSLQEEQQKRLEQPAKKMEITQFWVLIDKIDWSQTKGLTILEPLVNAVALLPISEIYQFSERLADLLHQLDGPDFAKALEEDPMGYSADTFLYARCFALAKGQAFYENVLSKTTPLPAAYLESLLSVADKAYTQKTGKSYQYTPSTIYESFFNKDLWGEQAITI